jgi:ferredoxin
MTEGYSTATAEARALGFGAGMGLPNIRRSSDRLRVTSRMGEGTRVSFTVFLRPGVTCAAPAISLYASADRCRDCRACLTACPTQALRVRDGRPMVLEHLCVECTQCIAACTSGALTVRDVLSSVDDVSAPEETPLVVPPALLAGCGADYPPAQVFAALGRLGFAGVRTVAPFEEALRRAVTGTAAGEGGEPSPGETEAPRPIIVPVCPAIVNLVELKFPSLVGSVAPFDSPWQAAAALSEEARMACVVSCPSQRSVLAESEETPAPGCEATSVECLLPETLRRPVMQELTAPGCTPVGDAATVAVTGPAVGADKPRDADLGEDGLLVVSGIRHVMAVLEEMENGLLEDVTALEAYACEGGCFGSPLLFEDHHVARRRWNRGREAVDAAAGPAGDATRQYEAVPRRRPYTARPGVRLDADMGLAIQKLGRLQILIRSLPGRDCAACGAPSCAAFAEDMVMERASLELCPYVVCEKEEAES